MPRFAPVLRRAAQAGSLLGIHWWSLNKIRDSDQRFTPLGVRDIVGRSLLDEPPHEPGHEQIVDPDPGARVDRNIPESRIRDTLA